MKDLLNSFDTVVDRKGTYCTQWDFVKDRFGQADLLPFTISDMDFKSPDAILDSLQARVRHGVFGYTRWAHEDFLSSIHGWYKKRFHYEISPSWILYGPNVIYLVSRLLALVNPDKGKVFLFSPYYDGFTKILEANEYPTLIYPWEKEWDWEKLEKGIAESKVLLLCNPNNPNGKVWGDAELKKIVEICTRHGVFILSDDIHMDIVYPPATFTPVLKVAQEMGVLTQTIIITSASKTFNTAGLGGAYALIPDANLHAKLTQWIKEKDSLSSPMIFSLASTISAYTQESAEVWLENLLVYLQENLKKVDSFLSENLPALKREPCEGTYFAWINATALGLSSKEIQDALIHKGKVAIMNCDIYGSREPYLRMNIACPASKLEEGLKRIKISLS